MGTDIAAYFPELQSTGLFASSSILVRTLFWVIT